MATDIQLYIDAGCTELDKLLKKFECNQTCGKFYNCNARLIVAEVTRPFPTDGPYKPAKKSKRKITNAQYAAEYGVSKRQVAKAISESKETGQPVRTILKRISRQ